jgi:hypothetical protein
MVLNVTPGCSFSRLACEPRPGAHHLKHLDAAGKPAG